MKTAAAHPQVAVMVWVAALSVSRTFSYQAMTNAWIT
jgi:hypothetical protein